MVRGALMLIILAGDDRAETKDVRHWLYLSLLDYRPIHVDHMIIFLITDDSCIMYLLYKRGNGRAVFQQKKTHKLLLRFSAQHSWCPCQQNAHVGERISKALPNVEFEIYI